MKLNLFLCVNFIPLMILMLFKATALWSVTTPFILLKASTTFGNDPVWVPSPQHHQRQSSALRSQKKQERNENHTIYLVCLAATIFDYTQTNIDVLSMCAFYTPMRPSPTCECNTERIQRWSLAYATALSGLIENSRGNWKKDRH